tara:strand:+ start:113 stop:622 length:510 start_codon:yes stop_codon:yes gene_type:complete
MGENIMDINEIPVLARREIEARIAGPLIKAFMEEFGKKKTIEIASNVILKLAQENGRDLAARAGGNTFDDLANATTQWSAGGAIEREVLDKSETNYDFNIVRCKYAEMYKELGLTDLGFVFSRGRDGSMYSGFNEKIKLERTQTIMQGAEYCDFRLAIEEDKTSPGDAD